MGNLNHKCETDGCYRDGLWDWEPFNDCFGTSGIRISDVDGIVERNGLFLMLDGKRVNRTGGREISTGQRRLYQAFAGWGGHVVVFHGEPPRTVRFVRRWLPGAAFVPEVPCDLDGLKSIVADWFTWADGNTDTKVSPPAMAQLAAELKAAAPPKEEDWPEVAVLGGGIEHLKGARWTG